MTMFFFLDYGGLISKLVVVVHTYRYCSGWLRNLEAIFIALLRMLIGLPHTESTIIILKNSAKILISAYSVITIIGISQLNNVFLKI